MAPVEGVGCSDDAQRCGPGAALQIDAVSGPTLRFGDSFEHLEGESRFAWFASPSSPLGTSTEDLEAEVKAGAAAREALDRDEAAGDGRRP